MIFKKTEFKKAVPVYTSLYEKEMNKTVLFECFLPSGKDTKIHITAQNSYQLFINGKLVHAGPARAGHGFFRVDRISIEKHLTYKENRVCVLVCAYHCDNFYLINQQAFLCAEFTSDGVCFGETGSDFWKAYLYSQKEQRVQRYAFQRPFCEVYDFTSALPLKACAEPLELTSYSIDTFIEREVSYPSLPYESFYNVIESGIVQKTDTPKPFSAWWSDRIGKSCHGFLQDELTTCSSAYLDSIRLTAVKNKLSDTVPSDAYITLEARANLTGYVSLEVYAESDTTLLLIFDEILTNGKVDYTRMECVNVLVFKLHGGKKYSLLTAEPYTFKYASLISLGGSVKVNDLGFIRTEFNECEIIKRVKDSADMQIKRIYEAAELTFRQNAYDIFMDCPSRERAGWLCDSFFTSRVEYLLSGKSTVEHSFLSNFVMGKGYEKVPHGMLPMCYPADHTDGNFIPNWAMWYVIELNEYVHRVGSFDLALQIKDRIYALLDYFKGFENERGLLTSLKGWVFVEWSRCNSLCQDINYPTNMLYYAFKSVIANMYNDSALKLEAKALKDIINSEARLGLFYCDNAVFDESGVARLSGEITETCQYYAFFTGVASKEADAELWQTMVCDFGSHRKENNKWESVHFSNAFIGNYLRLELLMRAGLDDILEKDIRGYFDYMAQKTMTLWENDTTSASCNHGFASHVLVWLNYLGYIENK